MTNALRKPDETLRGLLLCSLLMGAGLFGILSWCGPMDALSHAAGVKLGGLLAILMTGVWGACAYVSRAPGKNESCARRFILLAVVALAALAARLALFDNVTADYESFLTKWVDVFRQGGFRMLTQEIGDYNLPYQYILALIARSSIYDLYLIKLVSITFDFALAIVMMRMTERFIDMRFGIPVFIAVLFSPTVLLNGAYWAQCDTLYVFFAVASLYLMLWDRPVRSVICMAIAFSFKLQTIFFFPMALFGLLHKKYKLRHALVFPLTYLVTLAPALALGRTLSSALMVYVNQSMGQYYERLTYNAGSIYQFFPVLFTGDNSQYRWMFPFFPQIQTAVEYYLNDANMMDLQSAALIFCVVVVLALTCWVFAHRKALSLSQVWGTALFAALFIPLVMPKMHDRYFFMAEMFAVLYAARNPRRICVPVMVIASSFMSYMPFLARQHGVPMSMAAILNIAAAVIVARDIYRGMRKNGLRTKKAYGFTEEAE